jgi:hypothetical protein
MGGFEDIYFKAPRLHLNGYYMLREKYVRPVEHGINMAAQKYNVIYFYRYMRFMEDGSVLYTFSNLKLKDETIFDRLSVKHFDMDSDTIKGEYMQYKDKLIIKISLSNTLFSFECTIQTSEQLFDMLTIDKFNLEIVD